MTEVEDNAYPLRAPKPPLRRAADEIRAQAVVAAFDKHVDGGGKLTFFEVAEICVTYNEALKTRGGNL